MTFKSPHKFTTKIIKLKFSHKPKLPQSRIQPTFFNYPSTMADNCNALQGEEAIVYHSDLGLAICKQCQVAFLTQVERHFRKYHKSMDISKRKELERYIDSLSGR